MAIRYNRLWKKLIDENMMKIDLREKAGITTNAKNSIYEIITVQKYIISRGK